MAEHQEFSSFSFKLCILSCHRFLLHNARVTGWPEARKRWRSVRRPLRCWPVLTFGEVVRIDSLDLVGRLGGYPNSMVDHEFSESRTVNKYDLRIDERSVVGGVLCECRSGYKNAFLGTLALQRASEFLNLWPAHGAVPSLRLDVDDVQAELVLFDYAVDAAVPRFAQRLTSFSARTTVPLFDEKIDNELLEKGRRATLRDLEDFRGQTFTKFLVGRFE